MKNAEKSAYPSEDDYNYFHGLTKREYACIKLGIPETGDEELDDLIRKSERKRLAESAMQGLLANPKWLNIIAKEGKEYQKTIVSGCLGMSDELLKQLEK